MAKFGEVVTRTTPHQMTSTLPTITLRRTWLPIIYCLASLWGGKALGQSPATIHTYFDNPDKRSFLHDIFMLQQPGHPYDSTYLLTGGSADIGFLNGYTVKNPQFTVLPTTAINGSVLRSDDSLTAYIIHLNKTLDTILNVVHFPPGTAMTVSKIRTTTRTGDAMGELYISGMRAVPDSGRTTQGMPEGNVSFPRYEYYIARLNHNFINGIPDDVHFFVNARVRYDYRTSHTVANMQPWDVNNKGEVIYGEGAMYIPLENSFSWLRKVDAGGNNMVVPGWPMHFDSLGQVHYGAGNVPAGARFSIINGMMGRRGSLRSHSLADWQYQGEDANGNPRPGRYPDDFFYRTWVDPVTGNGEPKPLSQVDTVTVAPLFASGYEAGPGRTGRYPDEPRSYGWTSIVCDKTNNDFYVGYIMGYAWSAPAQLTNPNAWMTQHEWDPTMVKFNDQGFIQAWDRGKEESGFDQPDHYQDLMEIDYTNRRLVVLNRQHGDGQKTSWRANELRFNPGQRGFKTTLNGTTGNVHISWLGSYSLDSLRIKNATFVAEFVSATPIQHPYTDPHYDGWQEQNAGWFPLNTTRLAGSNSFKALNGMKVTRAGHVALLLVGQRTFTTADAYQKMERPSVLQNAGFATAVRVYNPKLDSVLYSSLLCTEFNGAGFSGSSPGGVWPLPDRVITVGNYLDRGKDMRLTRTANLSYGHGQTPTHATGYIAQYPLTRIRRYPEVNDVINYPVITSAAKALKQYDNLLLYPNPSNGMVWLQRETENNPLGTVSVLNHLGQVVHQIQSSDYVAKLDLGHLPVGTYSVMAGSKGGIQIKRLLIVR